MTACTHCGGQVIRGTCLQCSRDVDPTALTERDILGLGLSSTWARPLPGRERHTRPMPLSDVREGDAKMVRRWKR